MEDLQLFITITVVTYALSYGLYLYINRNKKKAIELLDNVYHNLITLGVVPREQLGRGPKEELVVQIDKEVTLIIEPLKKGMAMRIGSHKELNENKRSYKFYKKTMEEAFLVLENNNMDFVSMSYYLLGLIKRLRSYTKQ